MRRRSRARRRCRAMPPAAASSRDMPPRDQPRTRAKPAKAAKAQRLRRAPQLLRRPGFLAVHSVEKSFGTRQVVRGVSIYVRRGEAVGLLGPNGAGKTTVFYMITGLIKADRGAIELDGHDVTKLPMYQRARLGHRLSAAGSLDLSRPHRRAEHPRRARGGRAERARSARPNSTALLDEFNITRLRKIAVDRAVRRRAAPRRNRARAGDAPQLHAARRTVRRHRSDRGRRHSGTGAPSHQPRHRRADHRPQCARDARPDRSRLYRLCRAKC